jgi:hypothetical protein
MNPSLCYCWHDGSGSAAAAEEERIGWVRKERMTSEGET